WCRPLLGIGMPLAAAAHTGKEGGRAWADGRSDRAPGPGPSKDQPVMEAERRQDPSQPRRLSSVASSPCSVVLIHLLFAPLQREQRAQVGGCRRGW
ncbi:hypothetical protein NDU88_001493, partial [Pleurodeles waltl]